MKAWGIVCFCGGPLSVGFFSLWFPFGLYLKMSRRKGHLTENGREVAEYLFLPCCDHGCTFIHLFALLLGDQGPWAGYIGDGSLPFVLNWSCSPEIVWSLPFFPQEVWASLCFPPNPLLGCCEFRLHCESWVQSSAWRVQFKCYFVLDNLQLHWSGGKESTGGEGERKIVFRGHCAKTFLSPCCLANRTPQTCMERLVSCL